MPIDYSKYHPQWKEVSKRIRYERAQNQCECMGECGLHCTHPGPRRCEEINREKAKWANGKIILTVAHLCHDPQCINEDHLRAMCQRCHLRVDRELHAKHSAETRRAKKYKDQMELFAEVK